MHIKKLILTLAATLCSVFLLHSASVIAAECTSCHNATDTTPGLHAEWTNSKHGQEKVVGGGELNATCLDCHQAEVADVDAMDHHGNTISLIVSPKDCSQCHLQQFTEFERSHHADAAKFAPGESNNYLALQVAGHAAGVVGCDSCHGGRFEFDENGHVTSGWPNNGIGRINPDDSLGSCSACHGGHGFSKAQARAPESCGKCHLGPDHPQMEIYTESRHGIMYSANKEAMNLDSDTWIVGQDYSAAPTCATCHVGATKDMPATHDIGERLSWNLRAPVSVKKNLVRMGDDNQVDVHTSDLSTLPVVGDVYEYATGSSATVTEVLTWEDRRARMQNVCEACHAASLVDGHYQMLDDLVVLYNEKFAKPVAGIMADLKAAGLTTATPFDEYIEWLWWEIWHHEGRRARSGAAMAGPDYAWWHGIYDVAKRVYMEFIPELDKVAGKLKAQELLAEHFVAGVTIDDNHDWFFDAARLTRENVIVYNLNTSDTQAMDNLIRLQYTIVVDPADNSVDFDGVLTLMDENLAPDLIGTTVKMVAVVVSGGNLYLMSNKDGTISSWNGDFNMLKTTVLENISLASTQQIEIVNGTINVDGTAISGGLNIYIGFVLNDTLVYFPTSIDITLN